MRILDKITQYLFIIFNIPSTISICFYIIYRHIKDLKVNGMKIIENNEHRNELLKNTIEDFVPFQIHINLAFWILINYFIYF